MIKTNLARAAYEVIEVQYTQASMPTKMVAGDGVTRPTKEFRMATVAEIMSVLGTDRQNAGTYFSRIFREQNASAPKKAKKKFARKQALPPRQPPRKRKMVDAPFPNRDIAASKKKIKDDNEWLNPKKRSGSHSNSIEETDMGTGFLENIDITPDGDIQAPIKRIDRPTAIYLGNEAMELLKVLEEYHGLEISRTKSRYENGFYQMDIRFSVKDSAGNTQTPEAQDFLDRAPHDKIPKEFLFKEFEAESLDERVDKSAICIIGWKRRATKNKVLFLRDGKRFVCQVKTMQGYLRRAGLIDG